MLFHLRKAGLRTSSFGYLVSLQSFDAIQSALTKRILKIAEQDEYILIGHSLGGVLIRSALGTLPNHVRAPKHVFLLGSPIQPARLAVRLRSNRLFRLFTGDCGNLLGCQTRMNSIAIPNVPLTAIAGTQGFSGALSPFGDEPNDGIVSLSEVTSNLIDDQVKIPIIHSLLPSSKDVADIILKRIRQQA